MIQWMGHYNVVLEIRVHSNPVRDHSTHVISIIVITIPNASVHKKEAPH